jgi:transposase
MQPWPSHGYHGSEWETVQSVAVKLGIGTAEAVRTRVRRAEIDACSPGVTSEESAEVRRLRAENRELPDANGVLRAASAAEADAWWPVVMVPANAPGPAT